MAGDSNEENRRPNPLRRHHRLARPEHAPLSWSHRAPTRRKLPRMSWLGWRSDRHPRGYHHKLNEIRQNNQYPQAARIPYARQILNQLVFQKEVEYEAKRLGITVSEQERADRIRMYSPAPSMATPSLAWTLMPAKSSSASRCPCLSLRNSSALAWSRKSSANSSPMASASAPRKSKKNFATKTKKSSSTTPPLNPEDLLGKVNPDEERNQVLLRPRTRPNFRSPKNAPPATPSWTSPSFAKPLPSPTTNSRPSTSRTSSSTKSPIASTPSTSLLTVGKTDAEVEEDQEASRTMSLRRLERRAPTSRNSPRSTPRTRLARPRAATWVGSCRARLSRI